nr:hypothetical protein GCM10020093_086360 [Planobispora longispora]
MLAVLPSSAVVLDREDRVLRASSAARAFGLVKGDRLVAPELLALARKVRRDGEIRESEIEVPGHKFGQEATNFAVRVAPLGSYGQVLVLAEDQTEYHRVEAVRRDFVANVSHELKTPVGALSLLAETIQDAADDPEAVTRFAGRMQHEAARLTYLVQDLITLSRIQGPSPSPHPARSRSTRPCTTPSTAATPRRRPRTSRSSRAAPRACRSGATRSSWSPRCAISSTTRSPTAPSTPAS